jgi:hypothetical protein
VAVAPAAAAVAAVAVRPPVISGYVGAVVVIDIVSLR